MFRGSVYEPDATHGGWWRAEVHHIRTMCHVCLEILRTEQKSDFPVTKVSFETTKRLCCVVGLSLWKWDRVSSQFLQVGSRIRSLNHIEL